MPIISTFRKNPLSESLFKITLLWALEHGVRRIVFASSVSVYKVARAHKSPYTEHAELVKAPASPYGVTKKWAEEICVNFRNRFESISIARICHIFGPGQPLSAPLARVSSAIERRDSLEIAEFRGHKLSPVYIDDAVDVMIWLLAESHNTITNVAGPECLFETQVIQSIASNLGMDISTKCGKDEPLCLAASSTHLDFLLPHRTATAWAQAARLTWGPHSDR